MNHATLRQRYSLLEQLLLDTRALWEPAPFHASEPPWVQIHPELYNALLALPDHQVERLEHDNPALCQWLQPHIPALATLPLLLDLPNATQQGTKPWPVGFEWDIPGRKWTQVEAFCRALTPGTKKFVDWCAGKGHLSRSVAFQHECPVIALEWNAALCDAARQYNQEPRYHTSRITPILQDVLDTSAHQHIDKNCHCIALHACGKLHLQLMHAATERRAPALSFSPCCYHLIDETVYTPLANLQKISAAEGSNALTADTHIDDSATRLQLTRSSLRLAMQETVTANGHARRLRERKNAWRLAFQQWLADQPGNPPLTLPSMPDRHFHRGFLHFCTEAARMLGVIFPFKDSATATTPLERLETAGWQAQARVQRLELVRHAFRRALEIWLCLDRACWLQQQGYEVRMATFCETQVTPRNILITAIKEMK